MSVMTGPPPPPARSSSGFSLLSKIKSHKESKYLSPSRPNAVHRTGSWGSIYNQPERSSLFSLPAEEGSGLKSRRLSASPSDDFVVDICPLETEFAPLSKFGRKKEIGKGASATVKIMLRKGDKKSDNSPIYAVKEFRKKSTRETEEEYVRKVKSEYTIAKSLDHPNVVRTVRLCTNNGRWNHVMEYCQQGELFSLVERKYFKPEDRHCVFKQVLRGVSHLHDHGIAHRDIKLENILMTDDGHIKISDFGVSEVFCGDHPGVAISRGLCGQGMRNPRRSAPGICGSKPYISPEVLAHDKDYDATKLDVWACGILFMTMSLCGNPWQSTSTNEVNYAVFLEGWKAFLDRFEKEGDGSTTTPDSASASASVSTPTPSSGIDENTYPQCGPIFNALPSHSQRRCILKMLHPDPDQRCSIRDALNDRWIKGIDCCAPDPRGLALANGLDVSKLDSHKVAAKMKVQAKHDHLPPPVKRLPQHRFDMGDGTSRYD